MGPCCQRNKYHENALPSDTAFLRDDLCQVVELRYTFKIVIVKITRCEPYRSKTRVEPKTVYFFGRILGKEPENVLQYPTYTRER